MTSSFREQLLNIYLLNLDQIYIEYENNRNHGDNPELYNSLHQLAKYYEEINSVPMEHRRYLFPIFKNFLKNLYSDFCDFNELEEEKSESFEEFLSDWVHSEYRYAESDSIYRFTFDDWISDELKKIYTLTVKDKKI